MPTQNQKGIYDDWVAEKVRFAHLNHNSRMIVSVSGDQSVKGQKLFESLGVEGKGLVVTISGAQTINGVKTFGSIPVGPNADPSSNNQFSRKKYVDDKSLQYVEIVPPSFVARSTSWTDWDLSSYIPAGAKYAVIQIYCRASDSVGVRKNGSALNRYIEMQLITTLNITVELDANRIVETKTSINNVNYIGFSVWGYWE